MTTRDRGPRRWAAAWAASAPSADLRAEAEARLRAGDLEGAHARARNSPILHLRVHLALLRRAGAAPGARGLSDAVGAPLSSVLRRLRGVPPEAPPAAGLFRRRGGGSTR